MGLLALAGCGGSSNTNVQHPVSVSIAGSPPGAIGIGANWQYSATVTGTSNTNVSWSLTPASASSGTIDASTGLYIAPLTVPSGAITITATSQADNSQTASTTVNVLANDPIGSVNSYSALNSCVGSVLGATCYQLSVSCPGVTAFTVYLKVNNPLITPIGTVLLGTGTGGSGLYDDPNAGGYTDGSSVVQSLLNNGYNTVQVVFGGPFNNGATPNGWLTGPGGVRRLACRYATVADWVYRNPGIINSASTSKPNSAPMCATGNSGGSSVIAYAVYEYGLAPEFAMIEPTSGPVMTRIDQGCSPCGSYTGLNACTGMQQNMCYSTGGATGGDAAVIDEAYQNGTETTPTPCTDAINGNPGPDASSLFLSDSILYVEGQSVNLPNVTAKQLFGDSDTTNAVPEGTYWNQFISPTPALQCLQGVPHDIPSTTTGAQQIASDIIAKCN